MKRRHFIVGLGAAGAANLLGVDVTRSDAEPPLETTKIRFPRTRAICVAPEVVAEELLRGEGFTDVQYVQSEAGVTNIKNVAAGKIDLSIATAGQIVSLLDAGDPLLIVAGVHVGCYELFGSERIRSVSDLKGRTIDVPSLDSGHYFMLATMLAHVGLHPRKDVNVVTQSFTDSTGRLADRKIDALMAFPPEPQELRAKKIGHVVVSTILDRPWSQYFCCMLYGNREFVRKHPVATKRAARAVLKAASLCALEPERVAQLLVDKGYTPRWRDYSPEDTVRFYSLRLHEAGVIKSSPQRIIAQGTDWRFLNELKRELKG
jgi:NitT/TauT family transport system substrate-binding protein